MNRNQQNVAQNPIEQWYQDIPIITKYFTTASAAIALAIQFGYLTPYQLYYHPDLLYKLQFWRILTNFLYFGSFGLDFLFHTFFMMRYFKSLEEGSFRNRRADFIVMIVFGMTLLLILGPIFGLLFLGSPLIFMMVYVWGRRNPFIMMSFIGLFTFTAPYLPWVLLGFSLLLSNAFPLGDFLGILVGHIYYYLADVYPLIFHKQIIIAPLFLKRWLGELEEPSPEMNSISSENNIHGLASETDSRSNHSDPSLPEELDTTEL